jgi:uncharacterized protein YyaL (SSP411 family)
MSISKFNRLQSESSPYLLQHAKNPVDWYPWGEEAFEKATREDKPILVSIGYAACHWCHVMERESFENEETAAIMNDHFINIKVDREERPDVDHIYMDAVQAMTGSGGWPLNVFLTPERKPFYGGTYFPPVRAFNRASWIEVLLSIANAYKNNKQEIENQANNLTEHIKSSNSFGINSNTEEVFTISEINSTVEQIISISDKEWGGFGKAPKFPQTFIISFLLGYGHLQNNQNATEQALLALNKMYEGGIYDHVGGGFSRYSTDNEWLVPHFEKMLYDNALLVGVYAEAYQLKGNPVYKQVISETLDFVQRELTHPEGGFFSALDADSEGEEGKFYVWQYDEVKDVLKDGMVEFSTFYDISQHGNWEGKNIIRLKTSVEEWRKVIENDGLKAERLSAAKNKLLERRAKRIRPQLDDKILLGWNALMNKAYSKAFAATGNERYKLVAIKNMEFLLSRFVAGDNEYYHTWKNWKGKQPAFLDDYACLIEALIELQMITGNIEYLDKAKHLLEFVVMNFSDTASTFFFYTHKNQNDVLVRKKEIFDGATPSGNALMARNLYKLSIYFDKNEWKLRAEAMLKSISEVALRYPTSFGVWVSVIHEIIAGSKEISIVGTEWENYLVELLEYHIPYKLIMCSEYSQEPYPMLREKGVTGQTIIYLCTNYQCSQPVNSVERLISLLSVK